MAGSEAERPLRVMMVNGERLQEENGQEVEVGNGRLSEARQMMLRTVAALELAESLADIKAIHDKASGIHEFAKLRKDGFGLQQAAAALRIRAEHKAGRALS